MYISGVHVAKPAILQPELKASSHYQLVSSAVHDRLEYPDHFSILALMHLAFYKYSTGDQISSSIHLTLAIRQAQVLRLDQDIDLVWMSASGTLLGTDKGSDKNFSRTIWL